ncbi:MAG: glycosyltransferase [Bacteroidota bacterium]
MKDVSNKRVLFWMHSAVSHIISITRIANILQSEGYDIYIASHYTEDIKKYIKNQNFIYLGMKSLPFGVNWEAVHALKKDSKNVKSDVLKYKFEDKLYIERKREIADVVIHLQFNIIFIDSMLATEFIILYEFYVHKTKFAFLQTMFLTNISRTRAGLNSGILPTDNFYRLKCLMGLILHHAKRYSKYMVYLGRDDVTNVKKKWRILDKEKAYPIDKNRCFNIGFKNVPEFILASEEADLFARLKSKNQYYVGFKVNTNREEYSSTALNKFLKGNENKFLIYCSFGTRKYEFRSVIDSFNKKLCELAEDMNDCIFVVSSSFGKNANTNQLKNIFFADYIPQMEILSKADLFITHGGLNSIKESIHFNVPMIVYPLDERYDQKGNSARITYYKLGLRGNIFRDSSEDIRNKMNDILSNHIYKTNIKRLNKNIEHKYKDEGFIEILKKSRIIED